jgi:hypothetical protein
MRLLDGEQLLLNGSCEIACQYTDGPWRLKEETHLELERILMLARFECEYPIGKVLAFEQWRWKHFHRLI